MMQRLNRSHRLAIAAIVIAALVLGLILGDITRDNAAEGEASDDTLPIEHYEIGGEFELTNQRGERMRLSDLAGNVVLLFFGYTHCPDICPGALSQMREVKAALAPQDAARLDGVFISVDPTRDTPRRLGQYVEFFDPGFIGLTGDADEIARIAHRYGAQFRVTAGQPENDYLVDHSTLGYLIDPIGHVRVLYRGEASIEAIVTAVRIVLEEFS